MKMRLGVNIDHVATIRNARGEIYPDILKAAVVVQNCGANSITIHLREDRRHIKDKDLEIIKKKLKIPLNLEMAPTNEMLKIALKYKPNYVCIVPEKRSEITTEGGLNIKKNKKMLSQIIKVLKRNKIRVSLFIEPKKIDVLNSSILGADCIELHTGKFCNLSNNSKNNIKEFQKIKEASLLGEKLDMEVHAGHGLNYKTARQISRIRSICELNIGHFIISESVFLGLKNVVKTFIKIINK